MIIRPIQVGTSAQLLAFDILFPNAATFSADGTYDLGTAWYDTGDHTAVYPIPSSYMPSGALCYNTPDTFKTFDSVRTSDFIGYGLAALTIDAVDSGGIVLFNMLTDGTTRLAQWNDFQALTLVIPSGQPDFSGIKGSLTITANIPENLQTVTIPATFRVIVIPNP